MTTFTVWKFDQPDGAERAASILDGAESDGLVKVDRPRCRLVAGRGKKPTTEHGSDDVRRGAGLGAFWGLLFGFLFLGPAGSASRRGLAR